jgi:hypothetical protein
MKGFDSLKELLANLRSFMLLHHIFSFQNVTKKGFHLGRYLLKKFRNFRCSLCVAFHLKKTEQVIL